jgi:hypothetical protein
MFNFDDINLDRIVVHNVGNKHLEEDLKLSKSEIQIDDDDVRDILLKYFLTAFNKEEFYNFQHELGLDMNEIYSYATEYFEDNSKFYDQSTNVAVHLYEVSNHPNIKGGEFYLVGFSGCVVDGEVCDALGIFKSENKDVFLKVYQNQENFELGCESGINIKKLDKGCLIFNTEKESGYKVCIVDKTNPNKDALYWKEDFLNLKLREDNYYHTQNYLDMCKGFIGEVYNDENEVPKADQIDMMNKSINFFKDKKEFSEDLFKQEVIEQPEVANAFDEYKEYYQNERGSEIQQEFEISNDAVKGEQRYFKHVLKLDKNFHVYIHGQRKFIEKGFDTARDMSYYKLFFRDEQ